MTIQDEKIFHKKIAAVRALILQVVANHYPDAVIDTFGGGYTDDSMYSSIKEGHLPEADEVDYDHAYFSITGEDYGEDDDEDDDEIVEQFNYNWIPSK